MSHTALVKLTLNEREKFEEYLGIHRISEGKTLWEVVTGAIAKVFLEIELSEIKY